MNDEDIGPSVGPEVDTNAGGSRSSRPTGRRADVASGSEPIRFGPTPATRPAAPTRRDRRRRQRRRDHRLSEVARRPSRGGSAASRDRSATPRHGVRSSGEWRRVCDPGTAGTGRPRRGTAPWGRARTQRDDPRNASDAGRGTTSRSSRRTGTRDRTHRWPRTNRARWRRNHERTAPGIGVVVLAGQHGRLRAIGRHLGGARSHEQWPWGARREAVERTGKKDVVRVEEHEMRSGSKRGAGIPRRAGARVGLFHDPDPGVTEASDHRHGGVGRAVVDDDHRHRRVRIERRSDRPTDRRLVVERRNDDGEVHEAMVASRSADSLVVGIPAHRPGLANRSRRRR